MEINIEKNTFLNAIFKIQGIIDKKHTIPILSNVLISATEGEIDILATDLEIAIKINCKCDVVESGKVSITAKKLFEILKELPNNIVNIRSKDNYWVEIKCNKTLFNIVGLPPGDFPKFTEVESDNIDINKTTLLDLIEKTIFSVSNDETKYNLNGIFVQSEMKNNINYLNFISTDGHRLSISSKNIDIIHNDYIEKGFILPKKGIMELRKILENESEDIEIRINDNFISFFFENTNFIMRMIDGEFPDYKKVIPEKTDNYSVINRNEFYQVLKRISVIANEKSKGVKFTLDNNNLSIISSNPDLGDAKEEIAINYNGSQISIGFNAKYLLDILNVMHEENIKLFIKDNISPGMITPDDKDDFLSVVMPMRL